MDSFYDADLARLVSYVTFDGHLARDCSSFYLSSSNPVALRDFEGIVNRKFGLTTKREKGMGYGKSWKSQVYRAKAARVLRDAGAPAGDKMLVPFRVPVWIKDNENYSRAYLAVAFQCEGYVHKNYQFNSYYVGFQLNKAEEILSDGLAFVEELRAMLSRLGIATNPIALRFGNLRKRDGKTTRKMVLIVRARSCGIFHKKVGFNVDSRKNSLLAAAATVALKPRLSEKDAFWLTVPGELPEYWQVSIPKEFNPDLARFYGYLLRYGNIYSNLGQFYIASSSKKIIRDFARIVRVQFGLAVPYARKRQHHYACVVCSLKIGRWLNKQGLIPGKKKILGSSIPSWIMKNPDNLAALESIRGA